MLLCASCLEWANSSGCRHEIYLIPCSCLCKVTQSAARTKLLRRRSVTWLDVQIPTNWKTPGWLPSAANGYWATKTVLLKRYEAFRWLTSFRRLRVRKPCLMGIKWDRIAAYYSHLVATHVQYHKTEYQDTTPITISTPTQSCLIALMSYKMDVASAVKFRVFVIHLSPIKAWVIIYSDEHKRTAACWVLVEHPSHIYSLGMNCADNEHN